MKAIARAERSLREGEISLPWLPPIDVGAHEIVDTRRCWPIANSGYKR